MSRVLSEGKRLQAEEKEAEEALREAHRRANEAMARLDRLRRQKEVLIRKNAKLVNAGLDALDAEEEAAAELNRVSALESEAAVEAQQLGAFGVANWGSFLEGADLSASEFLGFGSPVAPAVPSGIGQASQGNCSSS